MHACYAIYVFICCCQPVLFILALSFNKHVSCQMLVISDIGNTTTMNNNSSATMNNSSAREEILWASEQTVKLDKSMGFCCAMACCFGVLYILVLRANDDYCFLHNGDDETARAMVEGGGAPSAIQALEFGRFAFWALVFVHAYMITLVASMHHDMEDLQIQITCRCVSMWMLCRTGRSMRGKAPVYLGACIYVFWVGHMLVGQHTTWKLVFIMIQNVLDVLLFVGHRWDKHTCAMVVLNSRLFYVACTCGVLLFLTLMQVRPM